MVIDGKNQTIYVFGGKTIAPAPGGGDHYSGLYCYDIELGTWKLLRYSLPLPLPLSPSLFHLHMCNNRDEGMPGQPHIELRSRIGHCMLFDHLTSKLFIFAGQRCKDYLWYALEKEKGAMREEERGERREERHAVRSPYEQVVHFNRRISHCNDYLWYA
jgi:hypothetical protein